MLYYKNNTQTRLHVNVQPCNGVVRFFNKIYLAIVTISVVSYYFLLRINLYDISCHCKVCGDLWAICSMNLFL